MFWNTEEEKTRRRLLFYTHQIQKFKRYLTWTDEQIRLLESKIKADEKRLVEIKTKEFYEAKKKGKDRKH
jgi:hypothetical protein